MGDNSLALAFINTPNYVFKDEASDGIGKFNLTRSWDYYIIDTNDITQVDSYSAVGFGDNVFYTIAYILMFVLSLVVAAYSFIYLLYSINYTTFFSLEHKLLVLDYICHKNMPFESEREFIFENYDKIWRQSNSDKILAW